MKKRASSSKKTYSLHIPLSNPNQDNQLDVLISPVRVNKAPPQSIFQIFSSSLVCKTITGNLIS